MAAIDDALLKLYRSKHSDLGVESHHKPKSPPAQNSKGSDLAPTDNRSNPLTKLRGAQQEERHQECCRTTTVSEPAGSTSPVDPLDARVPVEVRPAEPSMIKPHTSAGAVGVGSPSPTVLLSGEPIVCTLTASSESFSVDTFAADTFAACTTAGVVSRAKAPCAVNRKCDSAPSLPGDPAPGRHHLSLPAAGQAAKAPVDSSAAAPPMVCPPRTELGGPHFRMNAPTAPAALDCPQVTSSQTVGDPVLARVHQPDAPASCHCHFDSCTPEVAAQNGQTVELKSLSAALPSSTDDSPPPRPTTPKAAELHARAECGRESSLHPETPSQPRSCGSTAAESRNSLSIRIHSALPPTSGSSSTLAAALPNEAQAEGRQADLRPGHGDEPPAQQFSDFGSTLPRENVDGAENWSPAYCVERVLWPSAVIRLSLAAGGAIEAIAQRLEERVASGVTAVGFAAPLPSQGTTTLLLAVARHFVLRAKSVAIVDAAVHHPVLCQRLGVLPEAGWQDYLAGTLPLGEVTVRSDAEPLLLLPWTVSAAEMGHTGEGSRQKRLLEEMLAQLAARTQIVLVDLGVLAAGGRHRGDFRWQLLPMLAGVIAVWDARQEATHERLLWEAEIQAAGGRLLGAAENFVPLRRCA